jgi:hypothetical protein
MKKQRTWLFVFTTTVLAACTSGKKSQITNHANQNTSMCSKTIRYIIEKIKMVEGGNEVKIHAEITVDPSSKNINLNADLPDGEKKTLILKLKASSAHSTKI